MANANIDKPMNKEEFLTRVKSGKYLTAEMWLYKKQNVIEHTGIALSFTNDKKIDWFTVDFGPMGQHNISGTLYNLSTTVFPQQAQG